MYFDAVLDRDIRPIFNGTPQETREWLLANRDDKRIDRVCPGKTMQFVSVEEYLKTK